MGRRRRGDRVQIKRAEQTEARSNLERRWRDALEVQPRLAVLVTGEGAAREPFHRWLRYRQGFSPALVRLFLKENPAAGTHARRPILDPFSGSGTCVVECARSSIRAIGVEAVASLAFLARMKSARLFPPLPNVREADDWQTAADVLTEPVHRAALMLAVARRYTAAGVRNRGARPLHQLFVECAEMMREDLTHPLAFEVNVCVGDARGLRMCGEESIGGILTSPPYLSRHDYTQITTPYESVFRHWYPDSESTSEYRPEHDQKPLHTGQLLASPLIPAGLVQSRTDVPPPPIPTSNDTAIVEIAAALIQRGALRSAEVVRAYFHDLHHVVRECFRVLRGGAPCWMIIGGARIEDVYIPSDLILAELAQAVGFSVEGVRVARKLVEGARKFGNIGHVAPRESVIILRKP